MRIVDCAALKPFVGAVGPQQPPQDFTCQRASGSRPARLLSPRPRHTLARSGEVADPGASLLSTVLCLLSQLPWGVRQFQGIPPPPRP